MTNGRARNPTSNKLTHISTNVLRKSTPRLGKAGWKPGSRTRAGPPPALMIAAGGTNHFCLVFFPSKETNHFHRQRAHLLQWVGEERNRVEQLLGMAEGGKSQFIAFKTCDGYREELFQTATVSASLGRRKALDEMGGPASFRPPPATTPARGSSGTRQPRAGYFLALSDFSSLSAHLKRFSAIKRAQRPAGAAWSSRTALPSRLLGKPVPSPHPSVFVCLFPCCFS